MTEVTIVQPAAEAPPEPPPAPIAEAIEEAADASVTIAAIQADRDVDLARIGAETEAARIAAEREAAPRWSDLDERLGQCLTRLEAAETSLAALLTPPEPDPPPSPPAPPDADPEGLKSEIERESTPPDESNAPPEPPPPPRRKLRWI